MALKFIGSRDEISSLNLTEWNVKDNRANGSLYDELDEVFYKLDYPLPIKKDKEDYDSCRIYLFKNRFGVKEDHCFKMEINNKRSGIVFPLKLFSNADILSNMAESKDKNFLLSFLHIGFYNLLQNNKISCNPIQKSLLLEKGSAIKIEDFYDNETIVLLYHPTNTDSFENFEIRKFYPSLLKKGFVPILAEKDFNDIEKIEIAVEKHPFYNLNFYDTINFEEVRSELIDEKYINQIFGTILKSSLTPVSRFLLLYQVIEFLMDKIALEHYQKKFPFDIDFYYLMWATRDAKSYRDVYDNLKQIQNAINKSIDPIKEETKRISKLFTENSKLKIDNYSSFIEASKKIIGEKKCLTLEDYVYQLRNKIVHDYHNLSASYDNLDHLLINLNIEFEIIISDLVINYEQYQ